MRSFPDRDGRKFVLFPGVWQHIIEGHPEIRGYQKEIADTLFNPRVINRSKKIENRHIYYRKLKSKLFFAVVVDMAKGIIKTSYITERIKEGEMVWQEKK